jgi:hypothetical protein
MPHAWQGPICATASPATRNSAEEDGSAATGPGVLFLALVDHAQFRLLEDMA